MGRRSWASAWVWIDCSRSGSLRKRTDCTVFVIKGKLQSAHSSVPLWKFNDFPDQLSKHVSYQIWTLHPSPVPLWSMPLSATAGLHTFLEWSLAWSWCALVPNQTSSCTADKSACCTWIHVCSESRDPHPIDLSACYAVTVRLHRPSAGLRSLGTQTLGSVAC